MYKGFAEMVASDLVPRQLLIWLAFCLDGKLQRLFCFSLTHSKVPWSILGRNVNAVFEGDEGKDRRSI